MSISFLSGFYSKNTSFYQPNYIRLRQALRSPMSSERLNLESGLFAYDVYNLFAKETDLETELLEKLSILTNGSDETISIYLSGDATPNSISLTGMADLCSRIDSLNTRLEILEKGLA